MSVPRLLVITSCTGKKLFKPGTALKLEDFQDRQQLQKRTEELDAYACPAGDMYTGEQHKQVMEGINNLRQAFGIEAVDLQILSAGYGLISEHEKIVPYEVTFNDMKKVVLDEWASKLKLSEAFEKVISYYDLIFILLGEKYLKVLNLPVLTRDSQTLIFFAGKASSCYIRELKAKTFTLPLSNTEAKYYKCPLVQLKGFLFKRLTELAVKNEQVWQNIYSEPQILNHLLNNS